MAYKNTLTRISHGGIANRLVASLAGRLTNKEYVQVLQSDKMFSRAKDFIDWYNLSYEVLSLVFSYPAINIHYVLFGTEEHSIQNYTPYDKDMIDIFNSLSGLGLHLTEDLIYSLCPGIKWENTVQDSDPTQRLLQYLSSRSRPGFYRELPSGYIKPDFEYRDECIDIMSRLNAGGASARIQTDHLPLLARGIGVSLHWLLGLDCPLFCKSMEAERLFDLYTLLPSSNQEILHSMFDSV